MFEHLEMLWMGIVVHPYSYSHITCAGGGNLRENGVWPSLNNFVVSWLRLQTPNDCIPHPYWMNKKCLSTLRCSGWAYGYTLMPLMHCAGGGEFRKIGVWLRLYDVVRLWLR